MLARDVKETVYRAYVTDSLRALGRGEYLDTRWVDLTTEREPIDADEIIDQLVQAGGIEVVDEPPRPSNQDCAAG